MRFLSLNPVDIVGAGVPLLPTRRPYSILRGIVVRYFQNTEQEWWETSEKSISGFELASLNTFDNQRHARVSRRGVLSLHHESHRPGPV